MLNKTSTIFLIVGIIIGVLFLKITTINPADTPINVTTNEGRAVKEDEEICPYKLDGNFPEARISFLPVPVTDWRESQQSKEVVGTKFNEKELGKDLYKLFNEVSPWQIKELDVDGDLKNEKVYYGNIAMNHTHHIVYVVKDGTIIFYAGGANIWIDEGSYDGLNVSEILDLNTGKYKLTRYELVDGKYKPIWYQISCSVGTT